MLEIIKENELNFEKIFGKDKVHGYTCLKGKYKGEHIKGWKDTYSIFENKDIQSWIRDMINQFTEEGKDPVKFSFTSYIGYLQQYCNFNKTDDPSKLLTEDIDGRNARLRKYLTFLYDLEKLYNKETKKEALNEEKKPTKEYKIWLKKYGFNKSPSDVSIRNMIQSRIKSFFSNRDARITYKMKARKSGLNKNELTLDKDKIKKIQSNLHSPQYRLINKFETQTGLRISDVLEELTNGKYNIEKHEKHYFIRNFITHKEKVTINYLFFTTELSDLIISMYPESFTIIDGIKYPDLSKLDLSKLFMSRLNKRIRGVDYLARLKVISKELGFNGNLKTHAFRKYNNSQLSKSRKKLEDDRIITHWEGREAPYDDQVYLRHIQTLSFYYPEWRKIENDVCIDCKIIDDTQKDVIELKEDKIKLEKQITTLIEDNITIKEQLKIQEQYRESLSNEINKLRDWIGIDDNEVKAFLKERHLKLKEEKSPK